MLRCSDAISSNCAIGLTENGRILAVMKPLLDMLNHNRASQNEMCFQHGAFQLVHRGPGIRPGEEVRLAHSRGAI